MATAVAYRMAKLKMANKAFYDLDAVATKLRIIGLNSTHTVVQTHEFVDAIVANEIGGSTNPYGASGGWTKVWNNRPELATKTLDEVGSNVDLDSANIELTIDATAFTDLRFIVAYIEYTSDAASLLLCSWDFGSDKNLTMDNITLNVTGILRF